jgi:hypothetical protein
MSKKSKVKYKVATLDIETDPFLYGRVPLPFCIGFYDGEIYVDFWGPNCVADMCEYISQLQEPHRIYVHNGGGFDFWYLTDWITNPVFFINRRIAYCGFGIHQLRDSYRMIPVALAKFNKEEIDYNKFEENVREKHKKEILHYLFLDCKYLHDMVSQFIERYGDYVTIGSAALKHLRNLHPNKNETPFFDALFRPYYLGGRAQCFEHGEIKTSLKVYDVNSMYPFVMRNYSHPLGNQYVARTKLPDGANVYFAKIIAESKGALPIRTKQGLSFPHGEFEFLACSHEIIMALSLGLLKIKKVIECREFRQSQRFEKYVDHFIEEKIRCEENGDKGGREFAKLFLNSSYGKFGQNPDKYSDCEIFDTIEDADAAGFSVCNTFGERYIGNKKAELKPWSYNNVTIAASITSAARAELLYGITNAKRPVYCDTDSIICAELEADFHATKLGAWKEEATLDEIFIAGKKLYAGFFEGKCVKRASKGVRLDGESIRRITLSNEPSQVPIDAPLLRTGKPAQFISRKISATY